VDWKLELIIVPVADQDRAKAFYVDTLGWPLIVDHQAGDFRVVQVVPPGSDCAIALMRNPDAAGSVQGLHLVVDDIEEARAELVGRGVEAGEPFHVGQDGQQGQGVDPERRSYATFLPFSDPDGTGWLVQEVRRTVASA
jgi:catechol 2,3-dioxygenase-like lactoylglutathione lyase family enzyme